MCAVLAASSAVRVRAEQVPSRDGVDGGSCGSGHDSQPARRRRRGRLCRPATGLANRHRPAVARKSTTGFLPENFVQRPTTLGKTCDGNPPVFPLLCRPPTRRDPH